MMFGNIIYVPDSVSTIQGGIDAASSGDTVLVMEGTYVENINFDGKDILVTSNFLFNGDTTTIDCTLINGDEVTSVVIFDSNEDSSSILSGFTLFNGSGYDADPDGDGDSYDYGGGIYCENSSPKLTYLIVKNNISDEGGGGGIFCYNADPIIENTIVKYNMTNSVGGGMYCKASSNPILRNVVFDGNFASHGGGAYLRDNSIGEFQHCVFKNNSTDGTGGGITLKNDANIILSHVLIMENYSEYYGGGLYCNNAGPELDHVTITQNESESGGGIYCRNGSEPSLQNTIVWNNIGPEIYFRGNEDENAMTIYYSNIQAGEDGVTTNDNADVDWLGGNIEDDPLFCSTVDLDFTLVENSPCVGAGTDSSDMGALGVGCPPINLGPVWHVAIDGDDENDGGLETPYATIDRALDQAIDGDTIMIHPGTHYGNIDFDGKSIVLSSKYLVDGDSTIIEQTIISSNFPGSIVTFESNEDSTSKLMGITIVGGTASHGGGIHISNASPTIEKVVIKESTADYGGGIYIDNGSPHLINVEIIGNSANYGGSIFIDDSAFDISHVFIHGNMAYYGAGIYVNESSMDFRYVLIAQNESFSEGGGIYSTDSDIDLNHVTIADNISFNGGGAILAFNNSIISIQNSIVWNNSPQEFMFSPWESFNYLVVSHSNVWMGEDGILTNENGGIEWDSTNIHVQPLFCESDSMNYMLAINSPCRIAGNDNESMGAFDIGCEKILSSQTDILPKEITIGSAYPNPFNPNVHIPFTLPFKADVKITITNILGKEIDVLIHSQWPSGSHIIRWNGENVSSGIYFIQITINDQNMIQRVVLLK